MSLEKMINKSISYLINKQRPDGSIYDETDFDNLWSTAAYVILLNHLGIDKKRIN
ncbi:hypothetical protein GCM10025861_13760 [Methanobacterium petrolearium]|nr:hypothetical protein GCM10025861_13760 [Methanobacterium petrolearium]